MRQLIVSAVLFFMAGCNPSRSNRWSDKPLSNSEEKALAAVNDKTLTMRKTVAREDVDERKDESVKQALLQTITAAAGGTLTEAGVMLP
ncbi:MAG: hypothetical protein KKC76_16395 [Proteobacteria bacterium]|nr:hypothetical protein [Pseudomonadota bacterium]MBU4297722.1 hypothetical protein [Pseudomonadota bacterium]MCG2749599.1 hypothetical protein [Desulfobulbaceae bacterium]